MGNRADVVFFDLDDTLWRGKWGESPTSPYPGVTAVVESLMDRGGVPVVLTNIASPSEATAAMEGNGLDAHAFAAVLADTSPKILRVQRLLPRIGVRWDRVAIVDDDPTVRQDFAQAGATAFPDLASLGAWLKPQPHVARASVAARQTIRRIGLELAQTTVDTPEVIAYLHSRGFRIAVHIASDARDFARAAELLYRSAQLHLCPSFVQGCEDPVEVEHLLRSPQTELWVVVVGMQNTNLGVQGCLVLDPEGRVVIDLSFSCSILPFRVVERVGVVEFLQHAIPRFGTVRFKVEQTPANERVRWLLADLGGKHTSEGITFSEAPLPGPAESEWVRHSMGETLEPETQGVFELAAWFDRVAWPLLPFRAGVTVLDLGHGHGEILGPQRNAGLARGLLLANGRLIRADIVPTSPEVVMMDAHSLDLSDNSVDALLALELLEHVEHPARVFQEVTRVLASGGILVLSVPGPAYPYHPFARDVSRYSSHFLRRLLSPLGDLLDLTPYSMGDLEFRTALAWRKTREVSAEEVHARFVAAETPRLPGGLTLYS